MDSFFVTKMAKSKPLKGLLLKIGPRKTITLKEFFYPEKASQLVGYIRKIEQHMIENDPKVFATYSAMEKKVDAMSRRGGVAYLVE